MFIRLNTEDIERTKIDVKGIKEFEPLSTLDSFSLKDLQDEIARRKDTIISEKINLLKESIEELEIIGISIRYNRDSDYVLSSNFEYDKEKGCIFYNDYEK